MATREGTGEFVVVSRRNLAKARPSRLVQQPLYASWKAIDSKVISDIACTYSHS